MLIGGFLYTLRPIFPLKTGAMKTADVRSAYLKFFEARGHRVVASSTLVPHNDPTLLFTNAGMNQFKDALLGREDPGYKRA
jgi:alanyl-tRNA synthetase